VDARAFKSLIFSRSCTDAHLVNSFSLKPFILVYRKIKGLIDFFEGNGMIKKNSQHFCVEKLQKAILKRIKFSV